MSFILMPMLEEMSPTAMDNVSEAVLNFAGMRTRGNTLPSLQAVDRSPRYIVGCHWALVPGADDVAALRTRTTLAAALFLRWRCEPHEVVFLADTYMAPDTDVEPRDNPEAVECLWMVYARHPGDAWAMWLPYGWEDDGTLVWRLPSDWVPLHHPLHPPDDGTFVSGSLGEAVRVTVVAKPSSWEIPEPPGTEELRTLGVVDVGEAQV